MLPTVPACLEVLRAPQRIAADLYPALFARSGFTPDVEAARGPDLVLFTLDDLLP